MQQVEPGLLRRVFFRLDSSGSRRLHADFAVIPKTQNVVTRYRLPRERAVTTIDASLALGAYQVNVHNG